MDNLTNEKVDLLRHNARSVIRELGLLNDAFFEIGVTLAERHLLIELSNSASPTMGEVAERLLLDKSTASRLIARAIKKGYIKSTQDKSDKRKRFLHLTALGRKTLEAFEPIAFSQTKQALRTLQPEEIDLVYQGVALYAQGLRNSRLQQHPAPTDTAGQQSLDCLGELKSQLSLKGVSLDLFKQEDEAPLYEIFKDVVEHGEGFPYESSSIQEFQRQFFGPTSRVYVCRRGQEVIGGFYIKTNYSGRCAHIANAAYMLKSACRGQGIGGLLIQASLKIAKELGFQAMQFNMVLSQNVMAIKLYQRLGFQIVGTIPQAVRNRDGSFQDGHILSRSLRDQ